MNGNYRIKAFYPNYFSDDLIAYVCLRIVKYFNSNNVIADVMGICSNNTVKPYKKKPIIINNGGGEITVERCIYHDAIPQILFWQTLSRVLNEKQLKVIAEWIFLRKLKKNDIAYLWPATSIKLYEKAKSLGCIIVAERINTLRSNSKKLLDKEFASLKIPVTHGIMEDTADNEIRCMELSDYIFSPSPAVTKSLSDAGISLEKVLPTSYGLKKSEILNVARDKFSTKPITAIFVGHICVRKGIHLLLNAWANSNVNGKLKIVGRIAPEIKDLFQDYLKKNPTIEHVNYVDDLKPIYEKADFFILPSLEEGSPLVTYLALGASLPVIVSPMGAGGVITDGKEGFIIDPHNEKSLILSDVAPSAKINKSA